MSEIVDVTDIQPRGAHRLWLRFSDGTEGIVNLDEHMSFDGVFAPFADPEAFASAYVSLGTVAWSPQADIDPVVLYRWLKGKRVEIATAGEATPPYGEGG